MVAYKVVRTLRGRPDTYRSAVNSNLFRRSGNLIPSRRYRIGHITRAYLGSLGIFCFDSQRRAKKFALTTDTILLVKGLGEPKVPESISASQIHPSFRPDFRDSGMDAPVGTVCYPAVRVLFWLK